MAPLGLQMTTLGALGGPGMMGDPGGKVVVIGSDFLWECRTGDLTPIEPGLLPSTDNNDMWDFSASPLEYTPEADATNLDEGFWEVDGSNDIQPILGACV